MIQAPSPSFYMLKANGEAAELIASVFSPGVTGDIVDVIVLSKEFNNDIEPMQELDASIEVLKTGLEGTELVENTRFNPLYLPMSIDELDDALDVETKTDNVRFTAMEGNPFILKSTEIASHDEPELITATVAYHQFDLPSYDVIMDKQTNSILN